MNAHTKSIRDYDTARMHRIAVALWSALLTELRDETGAVYMPMGEIQDASALLLGVMLSTAPQAKVPSQLRQHCAEFAKDVEQRTRQAAANPGTASIFDVVMGEEVAH